MTTTAQTPTLAQEAAALGKLKREAAAADAKAKDLKSQATQAEYELFARMEEEGVDGIKHKGTNYVPAATTYAQIQDRSEFIKWAELNQPELLETKERKALINELVREHLDNGESLPPGMGFYVRQYVSIRGAAE